MMKKKQPKYLKAEKTPYQIAVEKLSMFRHKDLQMECIGRGLEFNKIVEWSHSKLGEWYTSNFELPNDDRRLEEYDKWVDEQLRERGYKKGDALLHPSLRFGVTRLEEIPDKKLFSNIKPENDEVLDIKKERPNLPIKSSQPKATKDATTGVKSGTKKNLTYVLTRAGKEISEIIVLVKKDFPDAEEKSLKIWHKRCLKDMENEGLI